MSDKQFRVTFEPQGRTVYVLPETKLLEAAGRAGLTIQTPCGGSGTCGKCRIRITTGVREPTDADRQAFSDDELDAGWRLACQSAVGAEAVVHIPDTSRLADVHQILAEAQSGAVPDVRPAVRKVYVELSQPALDDHDADLIRLEKQIGEVKTDLPMLQRLGSLLRQNDFKGTAVLVDHHLIDFEPGDTTGECYGVAFDIGTTTVVGSLLDLSSGEELAIASDINPQVSYGDDVLSRIQRSGSSPDCLREIRGAVLKVISELIDRLCRDASTPCERIYEISFAGNTTMEHLLCGIDPTPLGHVPFVPAHGRGLVLSADEIGISIHPAAAIYVFPVIGGFVGGDTVAGLVATALAEMDGPVMMVDIGTNGEIVLAHKGKLWAASTAAGPAFEGARISCGMRAATGAIEKVVFDGDVRLSVIGGTEPVGICGSALVDLAAELLRAGIVTPEGRLLPTEELPDSLPLPLRERVFTDNEGQVSFLLAGRAGAGGAVAVNQRDVRELQLATGAIRAGVTILTRQAGLSSSDLKRVLIAGGFGSFIRRSNAQRIGLLPTDIDRQRIQYVGNASLNGARCALVSTKARKHAEQLARKTVHVQLSEDPNFQSLFAESMIFPQR